MEHPAADKDGRSLVQVQPLGHIRRRSDTADQHVAWQYALQLDDHLTAMNTRITQIEDQETAAAARERLAWARANVAGLDSLSGTLVMPLGPGPTRAPPGPGPSNATATSGEMCLPINCQRRSGQPP